MALRGHLAGHMFQNMRKGGLGTKSGSQEMQAKSHHFTNKWLMELEVKNAGAKNM